MRCPSCDADVQTSARFCPQCAAPMLAAEAAPADPLRAALEAAIGFQYRIVRLLGRGGMGAVYLAHELALDREVAIKVLPPDRGETPEGLERFRREARTAARLNHAHVVPLYTFGEVRGIVYYVMGYVKGEPLSARMKREGRMPADEARRILSEVCDALQYAHGQGVVHRDLKPDNVLIEEGSGRSMLTDFGIAKAMGSGHTLTATGAVVGTPHYMSPEQAAGKGDVDGRSDLYSLGVMGYAMLAGRLPFEGKSAGDILVQHMTKEPPPLAPLAAGAPEPLVKALTRCLAKDPAARWPDAKALRQALTPLEGDTELPESLRVVSAVAQVSFLGLLVVTALSMDRWISGVPEVEGPFSGPAKVGPLSVLSLVALVAVLLAALAAWRNGHAWGAILHATVVQPPWWRTWYPRPFRRPGDIWSRLPRPVRSFRIFAAALLFWQVFVMIPTTRRLEKAVSEYERFGVGKEAVDRAFPPTGYSAMVALPLFLGAILQFARAWKQLRRGPTALATDEVWRVLFGSSADRRLWSRPAVAAILEAPSEAPETREPASAEEIERSLDGLVERVSPPHRDLALRARDATRAARVSFAALDEELGSLAKDHDAALAKQIEERLVALGERSPNEPAERRRMRELLTGQAEFMRGIASRIDQGKREQARRVDQMKALWQHVERLRSGAADRQAEAAARLAALCIEIERGQASGHATMAKDGAVPDVAQLPTLDR